MYTEVIKDTKDKREQEFKASLVGAYIPMPQVPWRANHWPNLYKDLARNLVYGM
jgi:hypothetical protein